MERYVVEVTRRLALRHDVHVFCQEWSWNGDEKIHFHVIPKYIEKPSILSLLLFSYLTRKYLDKSFDIIHSHERVTCFDTLTVHCPCFRSYITEEKSRLKRFLQWISVALSPRKIAYLWLEKRQFTYKKGRILIAVSEKVKKNVQENYPLPDDYFGFAYPGVDSNFMEKGEDGKDREKTRSNLGIDSDDMVVLFVGTEFRRKGLDSLFRGFAMIDRSDMKLVVAGGGDQARYRRLASKLGIEDRVMFLGLVDGIEEIYRMSDIYILPTLSEPAGMSPIEAMAAGVPAVLSSSRYAGSAELIKHGEALILENPDQPGDIADALSRLMDKDLRMELGERGRNLAKGLTWEKTTQDTLAVYYRILELKRTRGSDSSSGC